EKRLAQARDAHQLLRRRGALGPLAFLRQVPARERFGSARVKRLRAREEAVALGSERRLQLGARRRLAGLAQPAVAILQPVGEEPGRLDRKSTRLNSSHEWISYAVF